MMREMVVNEAAHEEVAMVVAGVPAELKRILRCCAGGLEELWLELLDEELVVEALVDKDGRARPRVRADQLARVVLGACLQAALEVLPECRATPRALGRSADGRQRRCGREAARVAQEERESAVAAHRVARDRHARCVDVERARAEGQELVHDVALHLEARPLVRRLVGVDVKARPLAEFPRARVHHAAARRRVWADHGEPELGRALLERALGRRSLVVARQPGEEDDGGEGPRRLRRRAHDAALALISARRQEDAERHVGARDSGAVFEALLRAAPRCARREQLQRRAAVCRGLGGTVRLAVRDDSAQALARVQRLDSARRPLHASEGVRDVAIDRELAREHAAHEAGYLRAALPAAESGAAPAPASHELKRPRRNLLARARDADHTRDAPAPVGRFERRAHHRGVARAVERVVHAPRGARDELRDDGLVLERVDALRRPKLGRSRKLVGVDVDGEDARCARELRRLNHREADRAQPEDSDARARLDPARVPHRAPARRHAASQQAHLVEWRRGCDLGARDLRQDRVLGES
mmetsp:Transcript_2201/g.5651  ORF Transcript_2201/g.5651 Transcript_2201/m.5651 type:complete len:532 (-) Transcript_2201:177-1772(-)